MLKDKVCFVLATELTVQSFLINHLRSLAVSYEITVIVNTDNPNFLAENGISANLIPIDLARKINFIGDMVCLLKLIKIFRSQRFSVVHSVTPKAGLLAMVAAWITRVPYRIHTFTGQVWITKKGLKRYLLMKLDCLISFLSTKNIVDSPSQQLFLIKNNVIPFDKSIVFGHGSISGVDLNKFKPNPQIRNNIRNQLNIKKNSILFIFLGRLTVDKGVLDLAEAFHRLRNDDIHMLFVGPDEECMRSKILSIFLGENSNIHFIGHTTIPESYMAAADVLCLPSYREGFGSVIIEAAAVGVPAIASRIYGITDAVVDGETGLLHEPGNIDSIKICMEYFIANKAEIARFGERAKTRVIDFFDKNHVTKNWVDFYHEYIG